MSTTMTAPPSGLSFTQGFLLGQLSITLLIFFFIKFFIFGEPPPADVRHSTRARLRRQRTLSHQHATTALLPPARTTPVLRPPPPLTSDTILAKTYYNVKGHQPESLDWFNVLVAQTIAQLRADARHDDAVLTSLTNLLNGPTRPDWLGDIRVTEIELGDEFPIFSNCRVIPVEAGGLGLGSPPNNNDNTDGRLQARMDVDLSDVLTLGIETTLRLNWPRQKVAVLPVALAVSVVRFSGTLSMSFIPSAQPTSSSNSNSAIDDPPNTSAHTPTTLAFTFLDDYRLDLSVRSLLGSRSRLQDVPKIAQLIESRLHTWFDERCVEPRFQQIVLPSLWPRKKNTRGGTDAGDDVAAADAAGAAESSASATATAADQQQKPKPPADHPKPTGSVRRVAVAEPPAQGGLEARMAAEGQKVREAQERAERAERAEKQRQGQTGRGNDNDNDNGNGSGNDANGNGNGGTRLRTGGRPPLGLLHRDSGREGSSGGRGSVGWRGMPGGLPDVGTPMG